MNVLKTFVIPFLIFHIVTCKYIPFVPEHICDIDSFNDERKKYFLYCISNTDPTITNLEMKRARFYVYGTEVIFLYNKDIDPDKWTLEEEKYIADLEL